MITIYIWAAAVWIVLVIVAIINGAIRDFLYKPKVGERAAHQISTFTFIAALIFVSHIFINELGFEFTALSLWLIGLEWLIATVLFEFIFGHYVFGNSWERLFADYNILKGRLWVLILIFTLISPALVHRLF